MTSTKQYLLGKLAFMLTTSDSIAEKLLYINRYDLGFDYFDKYRASVEAVTPGQVRDMAEKYIATWELCNGCSGGHRQGWPYPAASGPKITYACLVNRNELITRKP
ncbi:MAG: hypothetical protein QM703_29775 [Gemmatales bacterium]